MTRAAIGLVGNDVVDLDDAEVVAVPVREGFLHRVCNERERVAVEGAANPAAALWTLFAAKEAAFKAVARSRPDTVFAHRLFAVDLAAGRVDVGPASFSLRVVIDGACLHVVVGDRLVDIIAGVGAIGSGESQSAAARRMLRDALASRIGEVASSIEVVRPPRAGSWDGFGPPRAVHAHSQREWEVSLAHHGRFAGYALRLCAPTVARARGVPLPPSYGCPPARHG